MTSTTRRTRLWAGFAAGLLLTLLMWPTAVFAHAQPVATDPADGQVVAVSPEQVTITFSEPVSVSSSGNQLLNAAGAPVEAEITVRDRELVFAPASTLDRGTYIVAWRVVSADTHPVSGGFSFSVGAPSAETIAVPVDEQQREVELLRILAESLRYAGLLAFVGIVGFVACIAPTSVRRHPPVERTLKRTALGAATAAVAGQFLLMPVTALWESGEAVGGLAERTTWDTAVNSPVATAAAMILVGVVMAFGGWQRERFVVATAGAAVALASLVLVGHTRSYGPPWLVLAADLSHIAAAAIWWGGLIALIICLRATPKLRSRLRGEVIARFSLVAGGAVVVLAIGGVVLYWRIAQSFDGLWETTYGRFVLAKILLLVPVVAVAAWNRRRLVPRLTGTTDREADKFLSRMIKIEIAILTVVLAATSVLVTKAPPAPDITAPPAISEQVLDLELDADQRATIVITPVRRGVNAVQVTVTDADGSIADIAGDPSLSITLRASDIGPFNRPLSRTGPGTWEATADLPLEGTWTFALSVPLSRFENPVVTGTVEVP